NGCTAYMRPLPGAARMYPETDVPPVEIEEERIERIRKALPETLEERKRRYMEEYGLNEELANKILRANFPLFERIMEKVDITATLVIRTLTDTLNELMREGVEVERLEEHHFIRMFELFSRHNYGKEAIPEILKFLARNPERSVEEAVKEIGLEAIDIEKVEKFIEEVIKSRLEFIKERGLRSIDPLMGVLMRELRGKVDGKTVNKILREKVSKLLERGWGD
ncbi:MAG: Glu-tRNA(Gln) amidotransferase subunit GatE, partial [Candidatus Methanospirareceae archaeon]